MSELSAAMGGDAPKHTITVSQRGGKPDKVYTISLVTQGVKVAFEKALYDKARMALLNIRSMCDKDYYEKKLDELVNQFNLGGFALESEFGRKSLGKPGGIILLLSILMGKVQADGRTIDPLPEMEVISIINQRSEEVTSLFKLVMDESFPNGGNPAEPTDTPAPTEGELIPKA